LRKVCFFNIAAGLGGAERSLLEMIRGLLGTPYSPVVVVPVEGPLVERLSRLGVPVFVRPLPDFLMRLGRYARPRDYLRALSGVFLAGYYRWWTRFIREQSINIVHTNSVKTTFLTLPLRCMRRPPGIVWHIRDVMRGRRGFFSIVDALGRYVPDMVIANSDFTARQFSRCRSRVVRIYNGLVLDDFASADLARKADFKRRWKIPQRMRLVGTVGVISPLKGLDVFLKAAHDILKKRDDVHFFVIGDEIYDTTGHRGFRRSLQDAAARLGVAPSVTFTGFLDCIETVIGCLDVLVQASTEPESFGRVVVEAQASGVPVVASRIGAIPEIIADDGIGLLVRPGSVDELAGAVLRLLESDRLYHSVAGAARRHVGLHFSIERVIGELTRLYDGLLAEKNEGE
jgi:glycosyltransferase involved in cell wall biosynthesis